MNEMFRKLRGLLGFGLTWGILWAAIITVAGMVIGVLDPDSIDPGEGPLVVGAIMGMVGFISGIGFGSFLSVGESRKRKAELKAGAHRG